MVPLPAAPAPADPSPALPSPVRPSPLWPTPSAHPAFKVWDSKPLPVAQHNHGASATTTMLLIFVPGILAAAALRPGRGGGRGRSGS
ncbi:hypothetical protein [Kitasatospora aureofaciens]|uniref:hypothetical protein n=1 Tax=Kitasatospora aureofaciens TaxID=1894 RepID=UPI000AD9EA20|nr:hypothetical protein [Kitasatospora aureofaciens]